MRLATILAGALALAPIAAQAAPAPDAKAVAATLHRGVNIIGYDPLWKDPAKARFKQKDFAVIRRGGFDFVRVVLQSFDHMDAANRIDPQWLRTLDWVVKSARAAGLSVILDEHDFNQCSSDLATCRAKTEAFWRQVAPRYAGQPSSVLFELLNEPHDKLNGEPWNQLSADLLAIVRQSNPTRTIVIGPTHWNSRDDLDQLRLPENDRRILVTFHYYEPFAFTHQGAPWTDQKQTGVTWGSEADRAKLKADFDGVAAWGRAHDRPIELGEFGAYDGSGTPIALRAAWDGAVAREAEAHGFPWAYWQFDSDFILYDLDKDQWVAPIHAALIPGS